MAKQMDGSHGGKARQRKESQVVPRIPKNGFGRDHEWVEEGIEHVCKTMRCDAEMANEREAKRYIDEHKRRRKQNMLSNMRETDDTWRDVSIALLVAVAAGPEHAHAQARATPLPDGGHTLIQHQTAKTVVCPGAGQLERLSASAPA